MCRWTDASRASRSRRSRRSAWCTRRGRARLGRGGRRPPLLARRRRGPADQRQDAPAPDADQAGWDEETRRLELRFPDGEVVEGVVEPGPRVEATLYGDPHPSRSVPGPWQEAISARRRAADAAVVRERGRSTAAPAPAAGPRSCPASLERLAPGDRQRASGRRPPLPHALRDRRRLGPRGGRLARRACPPRRRRRGAGRRRRPLRHHDLRPGHGDSDLDTLARSPATAAAA